MADFAGLRGFVVPASGLESTQGIQRIVQGFLFFGITVAVEEFPSTRYHGLFCFRDPLRDNALVGFQNGGCVENLPICGLLAGEYGGHDYCSENYGVQIEVVYSFLVRDGVDRFTVIPIAQNVKTNFEADQCFDGTRRPRIQNGLDLVEEVPACAHFWKPVGEEALIRKRQFLDLLRATR